MHPTLYHYDVYPKAFLGDRETTVTVQPLGAHVAFAVMPSIPMLAGSALLFPWWAAALTLAVIALYRLLVATLPVLRLLQLPPARLAAKYDF